MISKPKIAILDLDMPLFAAASSAETTWYVYKDSDGEEVNRFDSADKGKSWIQDMEMLDIDTSEYTREVEYEIGEFETAVENFDKIVKRWLKKTGCKQWQGYVSKNSGLPNFRHELCTIHMYKGNRDPDARKPHYLEDLRKHVLKNPNIKKATGRVEADDWVLAIAQKKGKNAVAVAGDKDVRTCVGCWFYIPDEMDEPEYSKANTVGYVYQEDKKIKGCGYLFLLAQSLWGDTADNYKGCKGVGVTGAVKLLESFNNESKSELSKIVKVVLDKFMSVYGENYEWVHCRTEEPITVAGRDIFIEQLHLAYMKKNKKDICPLIDMVEGLHDRQ